MSAWYELHGTIDVDPKREGFAEAVEQLRELAWAEPIEAVKLEPSDQLEIHFAEDMSHHRMGEIEAAVTKIGRAFAVKPTALIERYESEDWDHMFVGPEGFDVLAMKIQVAECELQIAQGALDRLIEERAAREGR